MRILSRTIPVISSGVCSGAARLRNRGLRHCRFKQTHRFQNRANLLALGWIETLKGLRHQIVAQAEERTGTFHPLDHSQRDGPQKIFQ